MPLYRRSPPAILYTTEPKEATTRFRLETLPIEHQLWYRRPSRDRIYYYASGTDSNPIIGGFQESRAQEGCQQLEAAQRRPQSPIRKEGRL